MIWRFFFFFQAEDGIRDRNVTGVQTCALPIFPLLYPPGVGPRGRRRGGRAQERRHWIPPDGGPARRALVALGTEGGDRSRSGLRSEERRVGKECRGGWEA